MPQRRTGEPAAQDDAGEVGVGPSIRARRRALGLTQQQLADQTGISVGTVRDLEQGRTRRPGLASAAKLAQVLGLDHVGAPDIAGPAGGRPGPVYGGHPPPPGNGLRLRVLGPLEAWRDGSRIGLGQPRQRAVLGLLALNPGSPVHRATIIDVVWRDDPPATAVGLVQAYVSRLRRVLDPGRSPRDPAGLLVSGGTGYQLRVAED
jgi:transcriptional regulator with XRE-family HTH domain